MNKLLALLMSLFMGSSVLPAEEPLPTELPQKELVFPVEQAIPRARERLAQQGYLIPDEAFARYQIAHEQYVQRIESIIRENPELRDHFAPQLTDIPTMAGSLFTFAAMGDYDYDTDTWTPFITDAYAFDAEVFNINEMYTLFLQGIDHIVPDASFTDVSEDLSRLDENLDGKRSVSFTCNGQAYDVTLGSYGDWFNDEMIGAINDILAAQNCPGRLYAMVFDYQCLLITYGTQQEAQAVCDLIGGEPAW